MIILFPRCKGIKIATTIIFKAIEDGENFMMVVGMIYFAAKFGAITAEEQKALFQYLKERES